MCCASAPGYLVALIHHAVNSAAPSARAIFRTLAPSRRVCLRTARHLGSFSCRLSITFENLFVNGRICTSNKLSSYICDTSFLHRNAKGTELRLLRYYLFKNHNFRVLQTHTKRALTHTFSQIPLQRNASSDILMTVIRKKEESHTFYAIPLFHIPGIFQRSQPLESSKNRERCFSKKSKYLRTFSSSVHFLVCTGLESRS